jgi:hypothetical protein
MQIDVRTISSVFDSPFLQTEMSQQFPQYLLACALIHGFWIEVAFILRKEPIAPPAQMYLAAG